MELKEKLHKILLEQGVLLKDYEELVKEFDSSDVINQNIQMKSEIEKYKKLLEEIKIEYDHIFKENNKLKIALKEQVLDEKLNILKISKGKLDTYFRDVTGEYENRLSMMERETKQKLDQLSVISTKELGVESEEINKEISKVYASVQEKVKLKHESFKASRDNICEDTEHRVNAMADEPIDEEVIQKRIRQNNIEIKIGLNWINRIGILLILIGVSTALKFTYSNFFTSEMKGIFVFLIGILFLAAGEWFNRKEKNVFALGLAGGGIGILYLAVFHSYFNLKVVDLNIALLISILVTAAAIVLSLRYNSKTIGSFSLIGGFFPFFTYVFYFTLDETALYVAMGYLFILNLLTLLISLKKKWSVVSYLSFLLNVPTLVYLVFSTQHEAIGIAYSIITFAMYLVISLAYPLRYKISLKVPDVILLALNTVSSCIIIYSLFEKAELPQFRGLLALLFCLIYFGLGQLIGKYMKEEKGTRILFYLTSYTFAVLCIPFQLGIKWFAMGWLVEGVLMIVYGYKNKIKYMEIGGWVIFGLCLSSVLCIDFVRYELSSDKEVVPYFHLRYLCIIIGLLYTLYTYLYDMNKDKVMKYATRGRLITAFKYFTIVNLWIYIVYTVNSFYKKWIIEKEMIQSYYDSFFKMTLFALATVIVAFIIKKAPLLYDKVVRYFSVFLFILADLVFIILNFSVPVFEPDYDAVKYLAVGVLLAFNVFAFLNVRELMISFIKSQGLNLELYPLTVSIYFLANVTAILIVQFNLGELNLLFSLLYVVAAFSFIIFGFVKKYVYMRRFGLGLSVFSTAKLFIYDLAFLNTGGKIVSYFAFGVVLIGISFLYQRFSKSLNEIKVTEKT